MTDLATTAFDPADYLDSDVAVVAYMNDALATGDPAFVADALGVLARAKGMTDVARRAGVSRESLYRALSAQGNPELATVLRVVGALGLQLSAVPVSAVPAGLADGAQPNAAPT
jgi:probable addiction module antidote protein